MKVRKYAKFISLIICVVMVASCLEGSEAFAKSRRVTKPTKVNYKTIKIKAYKNKAKITFKKGKRASRYIIFYKAKNAKKWKQKVIKTKKNKKQTVTLKKLKKGTKYYIKIQGFKYKKAGKRWKKIRHRWKRVIRYKKVKGKASKAVLFVTKSIKKEDNTSNISEKKFAEKCIKKDKGVSLKYGNAEIHLGQTWTEELRDKLKGSSTAEVKKYVRPKFIEYSKIEKTTHRVYDEMLVNCNIYCYDTDDYNNFLRVDVVSGKVMGWQTNGKVLGTVDGKEIKRGTVTTGLRSSDAYDDARNEAIRKYNGTSKKWFGHLPEGATLIGGFEATGTQDGKLYYGKHKDFAGINKIKENLASDEKMIGFHYINAIRKLAGSNPLKYNIFFDCIINILRSRPAWDAWIEITLRASYEASLNDTPKLKAGDITRYGGQAIIETIYESVQAGQNYDYINHSTKKCEHGCIAGQDGDEVALAMFYKGDKKAYPNGENNGAGHTGETVASLYFGNIRDQKHTGQMLYKGHTQIGIGMAGDLHAEEYGKEIGG